MDEPGRANDDVCAQLEALMQEMRSNDIPTDLMERFFDVGEWLLCFEGAWIVVLNDPGHSIAHHPAYRALHAYFAEDLEREDGG